MDYVEECAAGRATARQIMKEVRADPNDLVRLVWSMRAAAADVAAGTGGHGVGFLFAVAQAAIR